MIQVETDMTKLYTNVLLILQILYDAEAVMLRTGMTDEKLQSQANLDNMVFRKALNYCTLKEQGYIAGQQLNYITQRGITYLQQAISEGNELPSYRPILERALQKQQHNLAVLEERAALHGPLNTPLNVINETAEVRVKIREIQLRLDQLVDE